MSEAADVPNLASLPPMPEEAQLIAEGKLRFVPDNRELEKAPKTLRIAGLVLVVACLVPWTGHGGGPFTLIFAKVAALLGCFCFYAAVVGRTKDPVPAGLGALTSKRWGKPYAYKTKGFAEGLAHTIPTPLHVLAILLTLVAVALPFFDPVIAKKLVDESGLLMASKPIGAAEVGLLLMGGLTLVHIYAYRRGGQFSPLYPFVFIGAVIMGLTRLQTHLGLMPDGAGTGLNPQLGVLGSTLALVGGGIAVVTIVMAMADAKKQGDAKKAAALEARKSARKTARA